MTDEEKMAHADKIKHLDYIQDAIKRMADNSFKMKGWMVAIVSALLAIYANGQNKLYAIFGLLPVAIFWGLDSYYLWQERKFRGLYNDVAGVTNNNEIKRFAMRPDLYTPKDKKIYGYWNVVFSLTILWLYLPVTVILLVIYFFLTP